MKKNVIRSLLTSAAILACGLLATSESHAATRLLPETRCDSNSATCDIVSLPPPPAEPLSIGATWNCWINSSGFEICRPQIIVWDCNASMTNCIHTTVPSTCSRATCPFFDVAVSTRKPLYIDNEWTCGSKPATYGNCDLDVRICYDDGSCYDY